MYLLHEADEGLTKDAAVTAVEAAASDGNAQVTARGSPVKALDDWKEDDA